MFQDLILEDEEEEEGTMGMVLEKLDNGKRTNPSLETWISQEKREEQSLSLKEADPKKRSRMGKT